LNSFAKRALLRCDGEHKSHRYKLDGWGPVAATCSQPIVAGSIFYPDWVGFHHV
jgi:hypothetical protein